MIVDGHGQLLLRLILSNNVAVQKRFDFGRTRQAAIHRSGLFTFFFFQDLLADAHTLVTDVSAWIVGRRTDQLLDLFLRLMAERTAQRLVRTDFFHWLVGLPNRIGRGIGSSNILWLFRRPAYAQPIVTTNL